MGVTPYKNLGLTKEQVSKVLKINADDIEETKKEAETAIQNVEAEVESLENQVKERDGQLETLKATAGDNETLSKKIEDLQAENATAKKAHETEMNRLKVDFEVEKALIEAKAKNVKAAKALLDLEDAKLDKDGNVKGLKELIDSLVAGEDTKFMFEQTGESSKQGFQSYTPGQNSGSNSIDVLDTSKMSYEELCSYMEQNPEG